MTTLHIDEYASRKSTFHDSPDTVYPKLVTVQPKLTVSGITQQSAAFNVATSFVSLRPVGGGVYVEIGDNPVATDLSKYIPDGEVHDRDVDPGQKVAVIAA